MYLQECLEVVWDLISYFVVYLQECLGVNFIFCCIWRTVWDLISYLVVYLQQCLGVNSILYKYGPVMRALWSFMDLRHQYWPRQSWGQYCCRRSIKPILPTIIGQYLLYYSPDVYDWSTFVYGCALGVVAEWSKVLTAVPWRLMVWSTLGLGTYHLRFVSWVY